MKDITKHYTNGELTINWQPAKCIHAAECVKALPKVYNPKGKPWLTIENATTEELKNQIAKCPSGALSYTLNNENMNEEKIQNENIKIDIKENGPALVHGTVCVVKADGTEEIKEKVTALCRCGASQNKPYCDGAHVKAEFKG